MTVVYFAPAVLRVERDGVAPNAPASRRWVMLSRLRTPLALAVVVCLAAAVLLSAEGLTSRLLKKAGSEGNYAFRMSDRFVFDAMLQSQNCSMRLRTICSRG